MLKWGVIYKTNGSLPNGLFSPLMTDRLPRGLSAWRFQMGAGPASPIIFIKCFPSPSCETRWQPRPPPPSPLAPAPLPASASLWTSVSFKTRRLMRRFYETNTFSILTPAPASLIAQLYMRLARAPGRFLLSALRDNKPQVTGGVRMAGWVSFFFGCETRTGRQCFCPPADCISNAVHRFL